MRHRDDVTPNKRQSFQARARAGVVVGVGLFLISQITLGTWIEGWRPELRDPTFEIKVRQLTQLQRPHQQPPATVVFLGSSMTANGFNAARIEQPLAASLDRPVVAYNLGINGNGPLAHLLHVQKLLRRGIRPDLVLIEVTPLMCDAREAELDIARFPANVLEHSDLDTLERHADPPELRTDWWQAHLVPVYGHRVMILNQTVRAFVPFNERVELWKDTDSHGWRPRSAPAPDEHRQILQQVEAEFTERVARHAVGEVPMQALRELTDLLAKERIATVLVLMPEGPLMRSLIPDETTQPIVDEFAALASKYHFPLVKARDWFDEDQFRDSYHLTEHGASAFSDRLLRESIMPTMSSVRVSRR